LSLLSQQQSITKQYVGDHTEQEHRGVQHVELWSFSTRLLRRQFVKLDARPEHVGPSLSTEHGLRRKSLVDNIMDRPMQ